MRGFKRYLMLKVYVAKFRLKILFGIIFILALLLFPLLAVVTGFFALGFFLLIAAITSAEREKMKKMNNQSLNMTSLVTNSIWIN